MNSENINRNGNKPIYKQIANFILKKIRDDVYVAGDVIPSERELGNQLDVSRYTVRKAIQKLVQEGYLYRVQGNGTFVFGKNPQRKKMNNQIGVIIANCDKNLESRILSGIERGLHTQNYKMTFIDSNDDYRKEARSIQQLRNEGVNGLIIMPAEDQKDSTAISDLKSENFPFVLVDRRLIDCETDCVMSDNIDGTYQATEHLIKLGHEKIAFIKREFSKTSSIKDRIIGYQKALNEYGIENNSEMFFSYDAFQDRKEINSKLYKFVKEKAPTAVVAVNDYIALDIVKMCREKNISIPDELSLVGFDDIEIIKHLEVPLTTVAQYPKNIGSKAAKLLIEKVNSKLNNSENEFTEQIYYPVKLVVRESCKKLKDN